MVFCLAQMAGLWFTAMCNANGLHSADFWSFEARLGSVSIDLLANSPRLPRAITTVASIDSLANNNERAEQSAAVAS